VLPSAEKIQIILLVISILFLALSFKRTIYGAVSYFIVLTAKIGDMYPELGKYRFELIVAIIVMVSILVKGRGIANWISKDSRVIKFTWLLFAVGMISVPQAVDINISWENGGYPLLKLMLFFMMIVASIHEVNDVRIIVWAYMLMGAWTAYEPVANYLQGDVVVTGYGGVAYGRFGAATGHVALANSLSQALPLTYFHAAVERNRYLKLFLYGAMLLMAVGIFATRSRGGFVGLIVFVMGAYYFTKKKTKGFIILSVILLLAFVFVDNLYVDRISTLTKGISSGRSSSDRYLGLVNGISMMIKKPILGVGIGCYAEARRQYFNYNFFSHNLYGELFGELGLSSIIWFSWVYMIIKCSKNINTHSIAKYDIGNISEVAENRKYFQNILMGVQVGIFVRLVLGIGSHSAFIWFWFLMAGLVSAIEIMGKNKNLLVEG
jgi:O-antigen ligase